jgi:hypothetical protein
MPRRTTRHGFHYTTVTMSRSGIGRYKAEIKKTCDLMGEAYLYVDFDGKPDIGAIKLLNLEIGGQVVDSYSGDAMRIYANGISKIEIDNNRVVIPLAFFFQNKPHSYIPLVALEYHTVCVYVDVDVDSSISKMALKFKAIYVEQNERRYLNTRNFEKSIYVTREQVFSVSGPTASLMLDMKIFQHIAKDLFIFVKQKVKEPLRQIDIHINGIVAIEVDHIMTRRIFPRESYEINDNKAPIYYIPLNHMWNLSKISVLKIDLTFVDDGQYDVVVVAKVHNVLRILGGMAGILFS